VFPRASAYARDSLNIGDFARYQRSRSSTWVQMAVFPALFAILSIFAAITAACCYAKYGEALRGCRQVEHLGWWQDGHVPRIARLVSLLPHPCARWRPRLIPAGHLPTLPPTCERFLVLDVLGVGNVLTRV
jgi:hypothetical protein